LQNKVLFQTLFSGFELEINKSQFFSLKITWIWEFYDSIDHCMLNL